MRRLIMLLAQASLVMASTMEAIVGRIDDGLVAFMPLDGFISYSIEFSSFPDFAGNKSVPNQFSDNLLENIGAVAGTKPYIRVGGNTQDFAIYNASLKIAINGTYNLSRSADYPTTIEIGPSYFESYNTLPNVKFSHGFNMGGNHDDRQWDTLLKTAALACQALDKDNLYFWEYGNEPDLFSGAVRPSDWTESDYVAEWLNGTRNVYSIFNHSCPDSSNDTVGWLAPSFAGTSNHLKASRTWSSGMNDDNDIKLFSSHNYISGAETPGVTLQGTLMNHTNIARSVDAHVAENASLNLGAGIPYILGETNSLYHQGRPGLSNTFGAALWAVDFALYCAAVGIGRVHFHMGTDYRYASWQPVATKKTSIGTKAPYYGNIAAAAFLGHAGTRIARVPLAGPEVDPEVDVAYASFDADGKLSRILALNMHAYNYTLNGRGGHALNPAPRPVRGYTFAGVHAETTQATLRRLHANGSDAVTGITWDGYSYNYELHYGRPVKLDNVTTGETVQVVDGKLDIPVPDSEAVILDFAPQQGS
ncbi:glycoside hydrolase family 79 protein [Hypoxylon sp. FL0543]|nr:glycoside hydrolase family 79 protein [Hypoxylon sp. FL0543]